MSERKVLNKYIPPDFDPALIPRRKIDKDKQQVVRLMAPFSMRCNSCGEYVYKGKKFNARKETAKGEEYYGIKIFRFYIKCPRCSAEITFKTDPKNTDYVAEHGASRNFEPWRDIEEKGEQADPLAYLLDDEEREDDIDPMKALEKRTLESKREMEVADALQDIRTRNARNARVDLDAVATTLASRRAKVASLEEQEQRKAEEEDEDLVKRYFGKIQGGEPALHDADTSADPQLPTETPSGPTLSVKRVLEDADPDVTALLSSAGKTQLASASSMLGSAPAKKRKGNPFGLARKK